MADEESIAAALKGHVNLDDDMLEYVGGAIVEELDAVSEGAEQMYEVVGELLIGYEACETEEEAMELCKTILATLQDAGLLVGGGGGASGGAAAAQSDGPKLLAAAVVMADQPEVVDVMAAPEPEIKAFKLLGVDGEEETSKQAVSDKDKLKAEAERAKLAEKTKAEASELQAELEFARIAAAKLRLDVGAGAVGTLELGPFNLPNPGGGDDLIENANLVLVAGHRYGLIGRNGKGKSTLLKFLASRRVGGLDPSLSVHYVSQEVSLTAENEKQPPVDLVLQADVQRRILLKEQAELVASGSSPEKLETVVEHLTAIDADGAPARAAQLLSNLGFSETLAKRPMEALSGGWRVRASLAAALFAKPDILLLDEPTNHLSIAAVLWLSQELSQSPVWASRVMVVVSHDRHFLDDCTTDSLHISGAARRVTLHNMSYSAWAKKRKEQQMTLERKVALRKEKIETLQEYAGHGFRYGGSSSQIGKMKQKLKESKKLEEEGADEANEMADLVEDAELPLTLHAGGILKNSIAKLENVSFAYPGEGNPTLFAGVDMNLDSKSRVCLLGENGEGKTTLVKTMLGELQPTAGQVTLDRGARVALVNQHHAEQLQYDMTPLAFMIDKFPGDGSYRHEQDVRGHLSGCGIPNAQQVVPSGALSGGQRSRVAMAAVSFSKPHLLVLDEPTNNLDLEAVAALADAVESFAGGVVLVSHDQYFVGRVAKEIFVVGGGRVSQMESFAAYKKAIAKDMAV